MPTVEKKRVIDVQATRLASGGYDFAMFEEGRNGIRVQRNELVFDKTADDVYKFGWYRVEFRLNRPSDSKLKFHNDQDEVFWIGDPGKDGCPEPYSSHPPITATRVGDKKIKVKNPDNHVEELAFALGFQEGDDPTPIRYDPVWGNKNGGVEVNAFQALAAGASVAGLLALTGWIASRAFGSDRQPKRRKRR